MFPIIRIYMKTINLTLKNHKIKIKFFLDYSLNEENKENFIKNLTSKIKESSDGFAGFKTKEDLEKYLKSSIFDEDFQKKLPKYDFNKNEIKNIIASSLNECNKVLPTTKTIIYIFPGFSDFIKTDLNGVGGFSPWKNTIIIDINPSAKEWKKALENTLTHEYNHSVARKYHEWETVLDGFIFEGFAEKFREEILGGKEPWTHAVSKEECLEFFKKLKDKLNSKDQDLYMEIFFGSKNYPHWLGYSLGYQIVDSYLKNTEKINWRKLIKIKPKEILENSKFNL